MMESISKTAIISKLCDIEKSVKGSSFYVGDETFIDSFVKVKFAGGIGDIFIGSRCYINSGCVLYSGNGITIGNNVIIAANTVLAPTNHSLLNKDIPIRDQGFMLSKGGIIIEDDVWIGSSTVILDGSIIRKGCVVGAGSLVRGELINNGIYVGNPLKLLKNR